VTEVDQQQLIVPKISKYLASFIAVFKMVVTMLIMHEIRFPIKNTSHVIKTLKSTNKISVLSHNERKTINEKLSRAKKFNIL
jgi:hypothetical protein